MYCKNRDALYERCAQRRWYPAVIPNNPELVHGKEKSSSLTESSHIVVHDRPQGSLPLQGREERTSEPKERCKTKNADVQPVELVENVFPFDGWKGLLVLQRVGHIVVGDVGVGGNLVWILYVVECRTVGRR